MQAFPGRHPERVGRREQGAHQRGGIGADDAAACVEQLRERRPACDVAIAQVAVPARMRGRLGGLLAQRLVDGAEQRIADAQVDEEAERREHDRHHERERQRQAQPDRQPAHPVSRRR